MSLLASCSRSSGCILKQASNSPAISARLSGRSGSSIATVSTNAILLPRLVKATASQVGSSRSYSSCGNGKSLGQSGGSSKETSKQVLSSAELSNAAMDKVWSVNSRLENMRLTAAFYNNHTWTQLNKVSISSSAPAAASVAASSLHSQVSIELPTLNNDKVIETPAVDNSQGQLPPKVYINPMEEHRRVEIIDPPLRPGDAADTVIGDEQKDDNEAAKKWAHRMLVIRKKKMKVHRRKRLWKKMWTHWKKKFYGRQKKREIEFRTKLKEAVDEAEKFDAKSYARAYLKDFHYEFLPKTYKGARKPPVVIMELLNRDKQMKIRTQMNNTNLKTGETLVLPNESVKQFIERNEK